ncbi:hypothetical protein WDW86_04335 [Bdellovibrionota bacterium FG-2]
MTTHPGRMSIATAISFVLLNATLVWSTLHFTAATIEIISYFSLSAYVHGAKSLVILGSSVTAMALPSALIFFFLATALIAALPDRGVVWVMCLNTSTALALRRVFPMVMLLPVCVEAFEEILVLSTSANTPLADVFSSTLIMVAFSIMPRR